MLRITSSKVIPYAVRAITLTNALINGCAQYPTVPFANSHHFCTDAKKQIDRKLVNIIKSEIKLKQMLIQTDWFIGGPPDIPFTFKDDFWEEHVTLSRVFHGEKIDVVVCMPSCGHLVDLVNNDDSNDDDDVSSSDDEFEPHLCLKVKITKPKGVILELDVSAYADGRMRIYDYALEEPSPESGQPLRRYGPHSVEEDGELQNALREYLKIRGIKKRNYRFLFECMIKKYVNEPVITLKELRNFIAD